MLLSLKGVEAGYGQVTALRGVDLEVEAGEIVTLIGANGAGKSTLLLAISGLVKARRGEIVFAGKRIDGLPPNRIVGMGIAQAPEGRRIFPQLTVLENLELGAFLRRDRQGVRADLDYVFSLFPILAERLRQDGGTLSGGEQQMLAIARAIMARPRLLLLDEPSLGLAPIVIRRIFSVVGQINREQGVSVLLVEQNANLALKTANRGYVLENGEIVLVGEAGKLLDNDQIRRAYLGV